MKTLVLACMFMGIGMFSFAQTDSTKTEKADTIKIGGTIIIRKGRHSDTTGGKSVNISNWKKKRDAKIVTNWGVVDIGFANYNDKTNYATAASLGFVQPGMNEDHLKLHTGKSVNVNIWFFMQRLALVKRVVNLKYGFGLELNNYRYDDVTVAFHKNPTFITLDNTYKDSKKNKLAADYFTVPMMLNFNFTPHRNQGFGLSGGISAGYLYSSRQKINFNGDKYKLHDDFNLRKWKLSYIGELAMGPIRLYGSYALKSMWQKGLDQTPYNVGIRFSHF